MAGTSAARADPNAKVPSPEPRAPSPPYFLTFSFIMVIIIFFTFFPSLLFWLCLSVCLFVLCFFFPFLPCACLAKVLINFHILCSRNVWGGKNRCGAFSENEISLLAKVRDEPAGSSEPCEFGYKFQKEPKWKPMPLWTIRKFNTFSATAIPELYLVSHFYATMFPFRIWLAASEARARPQKAAKMAANNGKNLAEQNGCSFGIWLLDTHSQDTTGQGAKACTRNVFIEAYAAEVHIKWQNLLRNSCRATVVEVYFMTSNSPHFVEFAGFRGVGYGLIRWQASGLLTRPTLK